MIFIIKPASDSFALVLEAERYKTIWKAHEEAILAAFKKLTGLDFQQLEIAAEVIEGNRGKAGSSSSAMQLPGDHEADEYKTCTLIHELSHRLLGGNALGPVALGLVPDSLEADPRFQLFEHRHVYLFLQDVIREAFGDQYAEVCAKSEQNTDDRDYLEAWSWAMSLSFADRQKAVQLLASNALPRERWHERDDVIVSLRDPDEWFTGLRNNTNTANA